MDKFAQAGYGQRDIGFGARPALIIVDFQKGFTDASNPLGRSEHVQRAVDNTSQLAWRPVKRSRFPWRHVPCPGAVRMR